jgi:hypothetical protein
MSSDRIDYCDLLADEQMTGSGKHHEPHCLGTFQIDHKLTSSFGQIRSLAVVRAR